MDERILIPAPFFGRQGLDVVSTPVLEIFPVDVCERNQVNRPGNLTVCCLDRPPTFSQITQTDKEAVSVIFRVFSELDPIYASEWIPTCRTSSPTYRFLSLLDGFNRNSSVLIYGK